MNNRSYLQTFFSGLFALAFGSGCNPSVTPDSGYDAATDANATDTNAADIGALIPSDAGACFTFDALSYTIPDSGFIRVPQEYPCLTVGINDACTGEPIGGASVNVRDADGMQMSAMSAYPQVSFRRFACRGEYTVVVSKPGYRTATVTTRPMMDRDANSANGFSDYVGVRLVREPDAGP